jgi:hypothetical protein
MSFRIITIFPIPKVAKSKRLSKRNFIITCYLADGFPAKKTIRDRTKKSGIVRFHRIVPFNPNVALWDLKM